MASKEHQQVMQKARKALGTINRLLYPDQRKEWIERTARHYETGGLSPLPDLPDAIKGAGQAATERAEREKLLDDLLEQATRDQGAV